MRWKRWAAMVAMALFAGYALICASAFIWQRELLFPAPPWRPVPPLLGGSMLHLPWGKTGISGFFIPARPGLPTVVHFHGNGEQLADLVPLALSFQARGLGFLGLEYPGYGKDRATRPSEQALFEAAEVGLRYASQALHVPAEQLVLEGHSLGTGVAVEMAARGYGGRLILTAPYTSISEAAAGAFPWLPAAWLVRDRFDSAHRAPEIRIPVLVVHGTADEVIPFSLGQRLSRLFPNATFVPLRGGHHADLLDRPEVFARIAEFALAGARLTR